MARDTEQRRADLFKKLAGMIPDLDVRHAAGLRAGPLLRTGEVALLFGVSEHCIRRWSDEGKLPCIRTLGRHRLFPARSIAALLEESNGSALAEEVARDDR